MYKIISYAVPNKASVNSGPMVRVTSINQEISKIENSYIIMGSGLTKLKKSFFAYQTNLLYVESSTNRISMADFFSLLMLKYKSKKTIVYIRDVYIEVFPDNYKTFRKKITVFFNRLSIHFYGFIADTFAFPTSEMGEIFFKNNNINRRFNIELPPACDSFVEEASVQRASQRISEPKIIYIGGIEYVHSGIRNFIELVKYSPDNFKFYIVTHDNSIKSYISDLSDNQKNKVTLLSKNKREIELFIKDENITFMFHSRPINEYDNITYPIKFFDALSWNLPILTSPHLPIIKILGEKYSLYVDVSKPEDIVSTVLKNLNIDDYYSILEYIEFVALKNKYDNRILQLMDRS